MNCARILRVFPRATAATPHDEYTCVGPPPFLQLLPPAVREVHVSCTFTWDLPRARELVRAWRARGIARVRLGGPATTGDRPGDFVPGRYLAPGYVITSRGCPKKCRHCLVPMREGPLRTLPITDGWDYCLEARFCRTSTWETALALSTG